MSESILSAWPSGSQILAVRFVATAVTSEGPPLLEMPAPIAQRAVLGTEGEPTALLLTIPLAPGTAPEVETQVLAWLLPDGRDGPQRQHVVLQGAHLHWNLPRVALLASADRIESVRPAVLEMVFLESELRGIETALAHAWPDVEADAAVAFGVEERTLAQRDTLRQRFLQVVLLRSRLAKITPRLVIPQVYPPTLASQMQERLRERLHVATRLEALEVQLEMFERIYDQCSQRVSDFSLSRKSYILEWVIVLILLMQTALHVVEFLVAGKTN
jgi:hypothetical protein